MRVISVYQMHGMTLATFGSAWGLTSDGKTPKARRRQAIREVVMNHLASFGIEVFNEKTLNGYGIADAGGIYRSDDHPVKMISVLPFGYRLCAGLLETNLAALGDTEEEAVYNLITNNLTAFGIEIKDAPQPTASVFDITNNVVL